MALTRSLDGLYGSQTRVPGPASVQPAAPLPAYLQNLIAAIPPNIAASIGLPQQASQPQSNQRIGTTAPAPNVGTQALAALLGQPAPSSDTSMQRQVPGAPSATDARIGVPSAPPSTQQSRMDAPAASPTQQQQIGASAAANPNTQQVSPHAQAVFDMMRQRAAMSPVQGMAADRGVFSGGQRAAVMPSLPNGGKLSGLYGGG